MHPFRDALALCVAAQAVWRVAEPLQVRVIDFEISRKLSRVFSRDLWRSGVGGGGGSCLLHGGPELNSLRVALLSHRSLRGIFGVRSIWRGHDVSDGLQAPTLRSRPGPNCADPQRRPSIRRHDKVLVGPVVESDPGASIELDLNESFLFGLRSSFAQLPSRIGLALSCSPHSNAMPLKLRMWTR